MKLWHILGGVTLSIALAGCAPHRNDGVAPDAAASSASASTSQAAIAMPSVSGTVNIRQRIALPANAVLTVTVSDASISDAPSKVISQHVARTEGKQAPFAFSLPYNPADIQPAARILLSAAITIDNRVVMVTETVASVVTNGVNHVDLVLTPVASVALPAGTSDALPSHSPQSTAAPAL